MKNENRLTRKTGEIISRGEKALVFFLTAGFPDLKKTGEVILALERGGTDIIELGVPFSDPVADGPVIQFSSQKALEKGVSLVKILDFVRALRKKTDIPIVLMSYFNPIYRMGVDSFFKRAVKSGIDGILITDIITEESLPVTSLAEKYGIPMIFLVAPTTSAPRQKLIAGLSKGFIYTVSLTGVTGERKNIGKGLIPFIKGIKKISKSPVFVGFGISKPAHAGKLRKAADGIVVGSALVNLLKSVKPGLLSQKAEIFAGQFRRALNG